MIFYNISHTNELDIIGFYPQTKEVKSSQYNIDKINAAEKVVESSFPSYNPNYGLELDRKSKETDVIDRGGLEFGFVISENLKIILEEYKLPPHRFYPIDVYNASKKYYWFHYITDFKSFFDVKNSELEIFDIFELKVISTVKFNSYAELISMNRDLVLQMGKTLRYNLIKLKSSFPNYDLFEIQGVKHFTLISEELKQRLNNEKITGLEYLEYDKINFT